MRSRLWHQLGCRVRPMGVIDWPLGTRLRSAWRSRTLLRRFAVIASVALVCSVLVSPGWAANGGLPPMPVIQIGLVVALLLATVACAGEGIATTRRSAHE